MGAMKGKGEVRIEKRCGGRRVDGGLANRYHWRLLLSILFLSLALHSNGHADLLVASFNSGQILRFDDATGDFTSVFATCLPGDHPIGMTLGPDGRLYVGVNNFSAGFQSFVRRFDGETGTFIDTFVSGGGFLTPSDLEFGPEGNLYVSFFGGTSPGSRIIRYDGTTGAFIDVFVAAGSGGLTGAQGIKFGPDGNLYVTSRDTQQVLRYSGSSGASLGVFAATIGPPDDLTFGPDGNLYVLDHPGGSSFDLEVRRFDGQTGAPIDVFVPSFPSGGQGFLTFGPDGNIYVSTGSTGDGSDRVMVFNGLTGKGDTFVGKGSGGLSGGGGIVYARTLCDRFGSYGPCVGGAGTRCRADGPLEAGKNLFAVTGIDVLSCGAADGPPGFQVTSDCPQGYTYCVQSHDDGAGNAVKLGVNERAAPGLLVVNDSSDVLHESGCALSGLGDCTLRDAITFSNADASTNEIHFAIPGEGVHTITLDSDLPAINGNLTIDGYTQPGASPNTNGAGLGDNAVVTVEVNGNGKQCISLVGDDNTIRGLVINRCGGAAITANVSSFTSLAVPSLVAGNFIGVDAAGSVALPNSHGVHVLPSDSVGLVIGGATPAARNVISGNAGSAIFLFGADSPGSLRIRGNLIGVDAAGSAALPNGGPGIEIDSSVTSTFIEISDNVVSSNATQGVWVHHVDGTIHGNLIGTDVSAALPLGNRASGIMIFEEGDNPSHLVITGNTIAFNGAADPVGGGIKYFSGSHHWYSHDPKILGNSIYDNTSDGSLTGTGLGIDLQGPGPRTNLDCSDQDIDGQPPQNFPVLTSALAGSSEIRIRGSLQEFPFSGSGPWRIEFFANPICDPSGFGEGRTFLGFAVVDATNSCDAAIIDALLPVAVPVGSYITATATDQSTSEFSACIAVEEAPAAQVVNDLVELTSLIQQRSAAPVPGGPKGTMTIHATFKNTSTTPIAAPFFKVTTLSEGNLLLNADGGPGGVGATLTGDVGADKILSPGESFTTEFVVGLNSRRRFHFFVDVWGVPLP